MATSAQPLSSAQPLASAQPLLTTSTVTYRSSNNSTELCMVHPRCNTVTTTTTTVTHEATEVPRRQCVRHGYMYHGLKVIFWLMIYFLC